MKKISKLLVAVLSVFMVCAVALSSVSADYSYTVTVSTGDANASLTGASVTVPDTATVTNTGDKIVITGLNIGDHVNIDPKVAAYDKYYIKGITEAGKDALAASSFDVTEDASYVVAYGVAKGTVEYTVNYVDEEGNLLDSDTYYAQAGDKPIVPAKFFEEWVPKNAYNLTTSKGIAADGSTVFEFVMQPRPTDETVIITDGGTRRVVVTVNTPGTTTGGNRGGNTGGNTGGENGENGENSENSENSESSEVTPDNGNENNNTEPAEIIDIDEEETPLAPGTKTNTAAIVGGGVGFVGLLAFLLLLLKKKKEDKEESANG